MLILNTLTCYFSFTSDLRIFAVSSFYFFYFSARETEAYTLSVHILVFFFEIILVVYLIITLLGAADRSFVDEADVDMDRRQQEPNL